MTADVDTPAAEPTTQRRPARRPHRVRRNPVLLNPVLLNPVLLNPVLRRELVTRWRGRRAFVLLTLYLGVIGVAVVLLFQVGQSLLSDQEGFGLVDPGPAMGRFLFENLLALVLLLVLFIGPGYAASQVVGERERQTLGLLQVTLVRPRSFVLGKLGASLAWLLLLVVATLPFAAATFFLGGVGPWELVRGLVLVLGVAVSVAAIALGVSAVVRSTTAAVVTTYVLVLALTIGTLFAALVEYAVLETVDSSSDRSAVAMYANPYLGLADAVHARAESIDALPSVITPFAFALPLQNRRQDGIFFAQDDALVDEEGAVLRAVPDDPPPRQPVWVVVLAVHATLGALGLAVATRRVAVPRTRRRRAATEGPSPPDGGPRPPA